MIPERIKQEREAFEAWVTRTWREDSARKEPSGSYYHPETEMQFSAWCAAKSHAGKSEWISVKDRLPDTEMTVLVCNERGEIFSSWASDVDVFWFYLEEDDNRVTHWQQLPEPPAEQSDAICRGDV